jgi:hypothetical protein
MHGAEDEEKVPDAHAHLDAVGVTVAILIAALDRDMGLLGGLLRLGH